MDSTDSAPRATSDMPGLLTVIVSSFSRFGSTRRQPGQGVITPRQFDHSHKVMYIYDMYMHMNGSIVSFFFAFDNRVFVEGFQGIKLFVNRGEMCCFLRTQGWMGSVAKVG